METTRTLTGFGTQQPWTLTVLDGCAAHKFTLPVEATSLNLELSADPAEGGFLDLVLEHASTSRDWDAEASMEGTATLDVNESVGGDWTVWAFPRGPVVDQTYTLSITFHGQPVDIDLRSFQVSEVPCE